MSITFPVGPFTDLSLSDYFDVDPLFSLSERHIYLYFNSEYILAMHDSKSCCDRERAQRQTCAGRKFRVLDILIDANLDTARTALAPKTNRISTVYQTGMCVVCATPNLISFLAS